MNLGIGNNNNNEQSVTQFERLIAAAFGFVFLGVLAYAGLRDRPISDPGQLLLLRVVAAVSAAACAAIIPGFIAVRFKNSLRAGGAVAALTIIWFTNPPAVISPIVPNPVIAPKFELIDISHVANTKIDWLSNPPIGRQVYDNIPFNIHGGPAAVLQTKHVGRMDLPDHFEITVYEITASRVHFLISGVYTKFGDLDSIGQLVINHKSGNREVVELIPYSTIRETWMSETDLFSMKWSEPPVNTTWRNVRIEDQIRGTTHAKAFLDMLSVDVAHEPITNIEIRSSHSIAGLIVTAITIESISVI